MDSQRAREILSEYVFERSRPDAAEAARLGITALARVEELQRERDELLQLLRDEALTYKVGDGDDGALVLVKLAEAHDLRVTPKAIPVLLKHGLIVKQDSTYRWKS